jgi:hypothetical protein
MNHPMVEVRARDEQSSLRLYSLTDRSSQMSEKPIILVTGGGGYIGAHCCKALIAAGFEPLVYDNFSTGHQSFVAGALVVGELLDRPRLAATFSRTTRYLQ